MYIIGSLPAIIGDTDIMFKLGKLINRLMDIFWAQ